MNTEGKNTRDVMEEYDELHNIPTDVTGTITHDEFVRGIRGGEVGFQVVQGEPIALVKGARKTIFNVLAMLYLLGPAVLVPLWPYHEGNWWLLIGIIVSWVATAATANSASAVLRGKTVGSALLLVCLGLWLLKGIHNYFTFFSLCAVWGCVLFQMAEESQQEYARQSLLESPELFRKAVAQGTIRIVRRGDVR
jgi:hypothetical protein